MNEPQISELPPKVFTDAPLYAKVAWHASGPFAQLRSPALQMHCTNCKTERTFVGGTPLRPADNMSGKFAGVVFAVWFRCAHCSIGNCAFLIRYSDQEDYLMKVGQFPPPDVSVARHLEKELGDYEEIFKKGLTCERFGYGIAAFAYYRRIVEVMVNRLVTIVDDVIPDEHKQDYEKALTKLASSHIAEDKLRLIKDLLPSSLRPDGVNPLGVIYDILSEGIHTHSDEQCLLAATQVRTALIYIVEKVQTEKQITQEFTEAMRGLLNRRSLKSP